MNTKLLLSASAVILGVAGMAATFLPHELLRAAAIDPTGLLPVLIQLLGASYFAFAMVDWTARESLIGGIYNRPVAIGNLTHFVAGALALLRYAIRGANAIVWIAVGVYVVFAVAFSIVFFRSPVTASD